MEMNREDLRKVEWKEKVAPIYDNSELSSEYKQINNTGYFHMWIKDKIVYLDGAEEMRVNALVEKESGEMVYVNSIDIRFCETCI